ncbi:MAG: DUF2200 domain-containing protein [Prevotella sp.]|nr:DUF2200 domain-containing protein [Prevotella sp.]
MKFAKVFPLLIAKAERKGRTRNEVFEVTNWLLGYSKEELEALLDSDVSYGDFIDNAPVKNPARMNIKGRICGIKVEEIEDPRMRDLRILDKLVDDLAKGKDINKIINV